METPGSEHKDASGLLPEYDRYCEQINKEDSLIDQRLNWLLTSQSLLFAAVGLAGNGMGEVLQWVIPWVGLGTSLATAVSVWAALLSLHRYRTILRELCPPIKDIHWYYPQLHRRRRVLVLGHVSPVAIPAIFCLAWIVVIAHAH